MILKILNWIADMFSDNPKWKHIDKNAPNFNKDGIEWRFNHNGGIEVNRYSLWNDPGFKKQLEACKELEKHLKNKDGTYKSIPY